MHLLKVIFEASLSKLDYNILNHILNINTYSNVEQQKYILQSLGAVYQNNTLLQVVIDFVLNSNIVRNSDKMTGLSSIQRCYGRNLLWNNMIANNSCQWNQLANIYQTGFLKHLLVKHIFLFFCLFFLLLLCFVFIYFLFNSLFGLHYSLMCITN